MAVRRYVSKTIKDVIGLWLQASAQMSSVKVQIRQMDLRVPQIVQALTRIQAAVPVQDRVALDPAAVMIVAVMEVVATAAEMTINIL